MCPCTRADLSPSNCKLTSSPTADTHGVDRAPRRPSRHHHGGLGLDSSLALSRESRPWVHSRNDLLLGLCCTPTPVSAMVSPV